MTLKPEKCPVAFCRFHVERGVPDVDAGALFD